MAETFYKTESYDTGHTQFGGLIHPSDFNTGYRGKDNTNGSAIANRIASDQKFDMQCRKLILDKKYYGGKKNA